MLATVKRATTHQEFGPKACVCNGRKDLLLVVPLKQCSAAAKYPSQNELQAITPRYCASLPACCACASSSYWSFSYLSFRQVLAPEDQVGHCSRDLGNLDLLWFSLQEPYFSK